MTPMATWKEKGIVLDSDDDDDFESQTIFRAEDVHQQQEQASENSRNGYLSRNGDTKDSLPSAEEDEDAKMEEDEGDYQADAQSQFSFSALGAESAAPSKTLEEPTIFLPSSPNSPRPFRLPKVSSRLDDDDVRNSATNLLVESPKLPPEDISRSYVRLTSPTSIQLSPSPITQLRSPPTVDTNNIDQPILSQSSLEAGLDLPEIQGEFLEASQELPSAFKRSFRQRKPIQLHPYVVEQEKYRQTLKAGGIAPLRLASSQNEKSSRQSASPDPESQDIDYQAPESQAMDLDWDMPSSSPPKQIQEVPLEMPIPKKSAPTLLSLSDDEDEFPDINTLVPQQQLFSRDAATHQRLKSYSTKIKRPSLNKIKNQSPKYRRPNDGAENMPSSPPIHRSASPVLPPTRRVQSSLSRAGSSSSLLPSPNWLSTEGFGGHSAEPPTPATSTTNPIGDLILLDSESEPNNPFASDPELEDARSESSSSEASVQIRKLGKKFRGVLPASHLRLGQQQQKGQHNSRFYRKSQSLSPVKGAPRRGVALPTTQHHSNRPSTASAFAFLSDESEEETQQHTASGLTMEDDTISGFESLFDRARAGSAEEDDEIDTMVPSSKRRSAGLAYKSRKKQRTTPNTSSRTTNKSYQRQPRITDHLKQPRRRGPKKAHAISRPRNQQAGGHRSNRNPTDRVQSPAPPRLSILDVTESSQVVRQPQFIRIAARTARSRAGQGRQSPSKKFIRLPTREDTEDAQSVLQDWKAGKILPKGLKKDQTHSWSSLQEISNNQQTKFRTPIGKLKLDLQLEHERFVNLPRKLTVASKSTQRSMNNFVSTEPFVLSATVPRFNKIDSRSGKQSHSRPHPAQHLGRPAQLESSEGNHVRRHPTAAFKSTKKALDAHFRTNRKLPAPKVNFQLRRFLADEDVVRPSVETEPGAEQVGRDNITRNLMKSKVQKSSRLRKQPAQRVDVGAALYRQPSNPLILEYLHPKQVDNTTSDASKLKNLGKFGTKYPIHFDIFRLQPGVFFHENTFIGSGCLSNLIQEVSSSQNDSSHATLQIGEKRFSWALWNGEVSSEIGVCFDWLLDQVFDLDNSTFTQVSPTPVEVVTFVLMSIQHHLLFAGFLDRKSFLSRMIEVLQEFSGRLIRKKFSFGREQRRHGVEVLSLTTMITYKLVQMARADIEGTMPTFELEELLKQIAGRTISLLLSEGLDSIRKLYDNLQYLSYRESGIKNDQYVVQAWVIILKVLHEANIPRGSFWEVASPILLDVDVKTLEDAPTMERLWYNLFTLLPLTDFDMFGVVVSGHQDKFSSDNWHLPQQLLKRVFSLYTSNHRQPPGFNDYCRALFGRCHHLMVNWGWWKCNSVIGTLFDFFASQNLADLRNEEVYSSPPFLKELDSEPTLLCEPGDPSFHIFLKIVALGIQHLRQINDTKSIRNLVTRLLPNHDRQYPKDEVIHHHDLASLRNHHDLLCTLYWVAPSGQRPQLSLIQELVVTEHSHKEACLISLQAWENLSRFVVSSTADTKAYELFTAWQSTFFASLHYSYMDGERDVREQAEVLQRDGRGAMTESQISEVVLKNRRSEITTMCTTIHAMKVVIKVAKSGSMAKQAFNCAVLLQALEIVAHADPRRSEGLLEACVQALCAYIDQVNTLHPAFSGQPAVEEDSQDSFETSMNWIRMELMIPLQRDLLPSLSSLMRKYLELQTYTVKDSIMFLLVDCWARLVSMITEDGALKLGSFLTRGKNAVFEQRKTYETANHYWPFFIGQLLDCKKFLGELEVPGFNIGQEWLLVLTQPDIPPRSEQTLTSQMHQKRHYLCEGLDSTRSSRRELLRGAIRNMSTIMLNKDTSFKLGMTKKEGQRHFSHILEEIMNSMQQILELQEPNSVDHKNYMEMARAITTDIKCYASDFRALTEFFVHPSTHYWPSDADPNLYAAGIISYCIRLPQSPEKTSFELFYYLHGGWRNAILSGKISNYISCIRKGTKKWDFTKFMLSDFAPAIIEAGFNSEGWLLCSTFLPILSYRVSSILLEGDKNSSWTFEHLVNILKIILNNTIIRARKFQDLPSGVNAQHRGILSVAFRFWLSLAPAMRQYIECHPSQSAILEEVTEPLSTIIYHSIELFRDNESNIQPPTGQFDIHKGKYSDKFLAVIMQDIKDNWHFIDEWGSRVVVRGRNNDQSEAMECNDMLEDVLEEGIDVYMTSFPVERLHLKTKRGNRFVDFLEF